MYCKKCGTPLDNDSRFCSVCGSAVAAAQPAAPQPRQPEPGENRQIGFSPRITDPAFAKYIKNSNRWGLIFSVLLAVAAIVGFAVAGETGSELENPQALIYGLVIGGMFIIIGLVTTARRKGGKTWDGVVADKRIRQKTRRVNYGDDYVNERYTEYAVAIKDGNGKTHWLTADNDDTLFNYYAVGDRVRYHGGLNSYEKYDKSRDSIVFCAACGTLHSIEEDTCRRCKCPLLK